MARKGGATETRGHERERWAAYGGNKFASSPPSVLIIFACDDLIRITAAVVVRIEDRIIEALTAKTRAL